MTLCIKNLAIKKEKQEHKPKKKNKQSNKVMSMWKCKNKNFFIARSSSTNHHRHHPKKSINEQIIHAKKMLIIADSLMRLRKEVSVCRSGWLHLILSQFAISRESGALIYCLFEWYLDQQTLNYLRWTNTNATSSVNGFSSPLLEIKLSAINLISLLN